MLVYRDLVSMVTNHASMGTSTSLSSLIKLDVSLM